MPDAPDRTVRVFISSTFKDMHAERDHLVTHVFPELRERCERLGLEFVDVDLRWGVPEKTLNEDQMEQANSWEYCRKRIDQVQPFFLCMLGHRYGWVPEPHQLKVDADKEAQAADARSITHMEVHHAVLSTSLKHRSYFHLRITQAPSTATDFIETVPRWITKLESLKTAIGKCERPVRHYQPEWRDDHFIHLEDFGKAVLDDLWSGVLRDERYVSKEAWQRVLGHAPDADPLYTDDSQPLPQDVWERLVTEAKPAPKTPLEAEREGMERFAESRLKFFQGRTHEMNELLEFIHDPAPESRLALLAAQPGQGKSALMAKLHSTLISQPSTLLITHFVGATSNSSSSYHLVRRLNDELEASGIAFPEPPTPEGQPKEEPKLDFQSLCQRLWTRLGDYDGERRIVILLDALNQLDDGHDLGWLPYRLGPNVRVVVSCIEEADSGRKMEGKKISENISTPNLSTNETTASGKVLAALDARHPKPRRIPLGPLTDKHVHEIVTRYLDEYGKQLDAEHVATICDEQKLPQARNPLYLLVMLAELRTLGGNDMNQRVPELIARMSADHPDTVSLFHWMLERLEQAEGFGEAAVRWWCLYLALGRVGMSSRELAALLKIKLKSEEAALTAQRIERALRRYLQRRGEQWDFFHGQLRQAVMERCTHSGKWPAQSPERNQEASETIRHAHHDIADYFRALADPEEDKTWKSENLRAFGESSHHLIGAEQWDDLCAYLTDFLCLDRRIRAGQVFEVVKYHAAAIAALPEFAEEARWEKERTDECRRYGDALIAYARECAEGKHPALPVPPATGKTMPGAFAEERSPRAARLKTLANFTANHATLLAAFPADFLPLAANAATDGPLAEAEPLALAAGCPWLHRSPRPAAPPLRPECLRTLKGHTGWITSVSVSPNGRCAISGSEDKTLRVWDLETGQCLCTLQGHTRWVTSVSVSPDGRRAISASGLLLGSHGDNTLRVWDLEAGQCLRTLHGHGGAVNCVSVSPDACRAVSGSYHHTLQVWDLETGQCLRTLHGHTNEVINVGVSPDGCRAVSASKDNTLRVWDLGTGQCLLTLQGHTSPVTSMSMCPDGRRAVSGSSDTTLRVWDLETGQCLRILRGHTLWIISLSVSPDGRRAVSGDHDTLRVWDLETGQCLRTFQGHTGWIANVSVSPDGCRVVFSGSEDSTLRVWNLETGQCRRTLQDHEGAVNCVSVSPDGCRAISSGEDSTRRVWDLETGQCLRTLQGHTSPVTSMSVCPDGLRAVSGSADKTLRVWNLETGQCLSTLNGHEGRVSSVSVSPDGRRAVSGSYDYTLRVWDLETAQCLSTLKGHTKWVWSVSVSPDGHCAVSASEDNTLRVWNLETGQCLRSLLGHGGAVNCVSVSPDGCHVVSGSYDHTLRVWDIETGQCLRTLHGHGGKVSSVCVSSDGRRAVSASGSLLGSYGDNTLRVWNLETGQCLAIYHAGAHVLSLAISFKRDRIVCCTKDGQMHFLTAKNVSAAAPIITASHDAQVTCPECGSSYTLPQPAVETIVTQSNLGVHSLLALHCPQCGFEIRLNPFFAHQWPRLKRPWWKF